MQHKPLIVKGLILIAVTDDPHRKVFLLLRILKLQRNIAGKTLVPQITESGSSIVPHFPKKVALERPGGFFIRRFIKKTASCISQQH